MSDNNDDDFVLEFSEEEGQYIEHLKRFLFRDDYPRPNKNDFIKTNLGKYRKKSDIEAEKLSFSKLSDTQKKKNIHEGHRKRLRETFNNVNPVTMPEHQILELLLSYVQPQKDVNPLAHELLNEFGSLANVLDASQEDLKKVKGIGEVLSSFIHFCSKIPAVYSNSKVSYKSRLTTPTEIVDYFRSKVTFGTYEEFHLLCLNSVGDILVSKNIQTGSLSRLYLDNRILVKEILRHQTNAVVVCHTHPDGSPKPSIQDRNFTRNLYVVLDHLNIKLVDHIIISPEGFYSFFLEGTELSGKDSSLKQRMLFGSPENHLNDY